MRAALPSSTRITCPARSTSPVLDDGERALVGTIYKQQGAFEAKRVGAPLVSRNIARHIEERFADRPRQLASARVLLARRRPLGRARARAAPSRMGCACASTAATRPSAGRWSADLDELPSRFRYRVICGATGSGKSRLLEALARGRSPGARPRGARRASRFGAGRAARRAAARRRSPSRPRSGARSRASIRRAPCSSNPRARRWETFACPTRSSRACATPSA